LKSGHSVNISWVTTFVCTLQEIDALVSQTEVMSLSKTDQVS